MKVCLYNVTTSYKLGGVETYCREMGMALKKLGHDVTLIAGKNSSEFVTSSGLNVVLFNYTERNKFPDLGTRFRKLMERLSFGRNTWRYIKDKKYDLVIVLKPFDFPVMWWLKKKGFSGKVLFHSGGTDFFATDKFFSRAINYWLACSNYTAKQAEEHYSKKVHVVHYGVDAERFNIGKGNEETKKDWGIPGSSCLIVSVGR